MSTHRSGDGTPASGSRDESTQAADLEQLVVTDPSVAVTVAVEAIADADRSGAVEDRLRLRRMLAMAYAHTNQFDRALDICAEAESLPGAETAEIELSRVRLASMQPLAVVGRVDDAVAAGRAALQTFERLGEGTLAGRAALNIGSAFAMTGRPAEALPFFDRARAHLGDDPMLLGQIETNRGTALAALDRFQEAQTAFEQAATLLNTEEMSWAVAIAEQNLADLVARQGLYNQSLRYFELSRRHLERDEAWGDLGRLNAEEATVLARMGLTTVARDAFERAIAMLEEHGTVADLAMALLTYGIVLIDANDLQAAGAVLEHASALIGEDRNADLYHQLVILRARLAIARRDCDEASGFIAIGLELTRELPVQRLRWQIMRADCAYQQEEAETARASLTEALAVAVQSSVTPLVAQIHQMLAADARASGDEDLANDHARAALDAYESIRETIEADRLRQFYHHTRIPMYGDLHLSLISRDDPDAQREAFDVAERIRSRTLLDAIHMSPAELDSRVPISESATHLVRELEDHRRWLNWMYSSLADGVEPSPSQLTELQVREQSAVRLDDRLKTLRPRTGFTAPLGLRDVQAYLDEHTAILSYLAVGDVLTAQVISRGAVHGAALPGSVGEIASLVASLQFQIGRALIHGSVPASAARSARLQRDTDAVLSDLHEMLIRPIASLLSPVERLVVVPSGDLFSVPFAALRDEGAYLVDRFVIATAPSASVLASMRRPGRRDRFRSSAPLIAGVPDESAPEILDEVLLLQDRFPHATTLLGENASQDAVLGAMPEADLIHLALHGRFDAAHPNASGLRVADDWLTLDELAGLTLDHPLVLLSGCETGRVRVGHGDDLEGMMAAMIAAGAGGLVTSLWKTHDAAAMALVSTFYDILEQQGDPVTALRRAQVTVRETYQHPALWAPFVAVHTVRQEGSS